MGHCDKAPSPTTIIQYLVAVAKRTELANFTTVCPFVSVGAGLACRRSRYYRAALTRRPMTATARRLSSGTVMPMSLSPDMHMLSGALTWVYSKGTVLCLLPFPLTLRFSTGC